MGRKRKEDVNGSLTESVKEYLEKACARTYEIPGKGPRELSPNTVRRWLLEYRRYGIDGLKHKPRNDDASRLLIHGEFFFEERSANLQTALKKAIFKRGIPKRIFADNGKIFNSLQLRLIQQQPFSKFHNCRN